MQRILRILLAVLVAASLAVAVYWNRAHRPSDAGINTLDLETVREVDSQAGRIEERHKPFHHYAVYKTDMDTGEKTLSGYAFITTDLASHVTGYIGPIVTLVVTDPEGTIRGVRVLKHQETPSYAFGIDKDWWLKQFIGLGPSSPMRPGKDIDGLSSATVSVRAFCQSAKESLRRFDEELLKTRPANAGAEKPALVPGLDAPTGILILLFLLSIIAHHRGMPRLRTALIIAAAIYLGIKLKLLFSVTHITAFLKGTLPPPQISVFLWVFLVLIILTTLIWGRIYCGFLCPFGAVQDILFKIFPRRSLVPAAQDRWMKQVKYFALWFLITASVLLPELRVSDFEPFALTFTLKGERLIWCFALAVLIPSLMIERFYCRYFCLAGAFLAILNRLSFFGLRIRPGCSRCGFCENICRTGAIRGPKLDWEECVLCGRCRSACPDQNVQLSRRLGTGETTAGVSKREGLRMPKTRILPQKSAGPAGLGLAAFAAAFALWALIAAGQMRAPQITASPLTPGQLEMQKRADKVRRALEAGDLKLTPARFYRALGEDGR